jgi:histone-lysine N-methyltransferase SETD3
MDIQFNQLKKWMQKEKDKNICICINTPQKGIYSSIDIQEDETIMWIDHKFIIEFDEIKNERLIDVLTEKNYHFVLFLYSEMGKPNSFWKPYLSMLPKNMNNYIPFYNKKDIELLNMTSFKYSYNYDKKRKDFKYNVKILYDFLMKTSQLYEKHVNKYQLFYMFILYLKTIVDTRVFEYTKDNQKQCGIVPYADLLNHSNNPNALWYFNDETGRFEIFSTREITYGEELCLSYGIENNISLLSNYGFTLEDNEYSKLCIKRPRSNLLVTFTHQDCYLSITLDGDKDNLRYYLKKIYVMHRKKIPFIKNKDIRQIFQDEIDIIRRLMY